MTIQEEAEIVKRNINAYGASDGRMLLRLINESPVSALPMIKENNSYSWDFYLNYQDRD